MFNSSDYKAKYQNCDLTNAVLNLTEASILLSNATNDTRFGIDAMGAVELDFSCAGMCQNSYIYSFSNTSYGPPNQNCSIAVTNWVEMVTGKMANYCWTFGFLLLFCGIFMCFLWVPDSHKLHSPLLLKETD